jgi:very-short-patch-repair endonuclease
MKLVNGITITEQKASIKYISLYDWEHKAEDYIKKIKSTVSVPLSETDYIVSVQVLISELEGLNKKLDKEAEQKKIQLFHHYKKITDGDIGLHVIRSRNKDIIKEIDRLSNELSQFKIAEERIEKNIKKLTDEDLSKISSKNEANIKKIDTLLQELSQFKEASFLSGLFGIISGRKKKVSILKDKSLNIVNEVSPMNLDALKTKCSNLSEKEVIFVIDEKFKAIRSGL